MSHHGSREAKALAFLRRHNLASAIDIGNAAVAGEERADRIPMRGRESIGLSIAVALTRRGIVRPTKGNMFKIAAAEIDRR
jgi:hypothetical protein